MTDILAIAIIIDTVMIAAIAAANTARWSRSRYRQLDRVIKFGRSARDHNMPLHGQE
ncbi:hypothetical protein VH570_05760 [Sphingobium sp. HT1-2]|jgi:hypothetical protein|uniref:hypothetical protein n=1 Tax=Sphingobium sp. HT1-2 TaxID=3111640 RepID=UPI003C02A917